ncbi:E3 ubiquitin-protein ligase RNF31 isoform X1 [Takifugu flavidus]|uniref:E3 ubiquitin-protein ligase RNF31 isoform X1 n=2 Tax=Takifugu flavidus TaxID=433684 RepID=UPI00254425A2|nr:E3 ubiquitin-protein ligase RNF31 isoform X1 [Takifugu flavidus]
MLPVGAEEELRTLRECHYRYPEETLYDLQRVRSQFPDLRLFVDFYCFLNKEKKRLVHLAGTLPVLYEGSEYNIPVCIWLHETHPVSRPRCYVCPSVSMVINPSCTCVDATGIINLDGLRNWTHGVSSLSLLVSDMVQMFQKDTPLYERCAVGPPAPESDKSRKLKPGKSYTEELMGIDFSSPPSSSSNSSSCSAVEPLSRTLGALTLASRPSRDPQGGSQAPTGATRKGEKAPDSGPAPGNPPVGTEKVQPHPGTKLEYLKMAALLPPDRAKVFLLLMSTPGHSFTLADVLEAVQLNRDFPSALKFLSHSCPICQEQVSFSQIITMTHCSCFLCQTCFKTFFSSAIKEKSIDLLVCPQCGKPEVKDPGRMEESMDYFNLLDTQIRHFLPPHIHELFQRKLRDRALQEMPNFRWCSHCSFGVLHEADRLRMDCPSCKKSTCSQCRSPWSPQHQGLSCQQFRLWQQQNQVDHHSTQLWSYKSFACPSCQCVFSLSRGGCLHFTCSQCQHQFCGGCSRPFSLGSECRFSAECRTRGLHAHHPRDCLYHLRDWSVSRLHLLLQHYRVSPTCLEASEGSSPASCCTGTCSVLELRDDSSRREEACGRAALPGHRGYCEVHYKERLVELVNHFGCDPVVLFSPAEMRAELQRWNVVVPPPSLDEPERLYVHRLRLTLTNRVPLWKLPSVVQHHGNRPPPPSAGAPHPLTD